eukprot:Skav219984  [mRNA]  locus=scaffold137:139177:152491:- [translate_table: standard]
MEVPLAQLLESKFPSLQSELQTLQADPGLFDELSFEHFKEEALKTPRLSSISEVCPPDSQHGGPNPLSALNTWNYIMNNVRAAIRHTTSQTQIDPQVMTAIFQVQEGIQTFLAMPSLEQYSPVVTLASQILEALTPWLRQQAPVMLRLPPAVRIPVPADGRNPGTFSFRLSNGVEMPAIGFGTWKLEGRALRQSGIPREQLFIATKATSVALGMAEPANMENLVDLGRVRALGVSNFGIQVYLQNIFKVYKSLVKNCGALGIFPSVWIHSNSVMMVGYSIINSWPHLLEPLADPHVLQIAKAKGRSPSQVLHRWALQHGVSVIPKASSVERIRENSQLLDFEQLDVQMSALDGLATLSETTHDKILPSWTQAMRDQQCIREPDEADCGYLVFYEKTGPPQTPMAPAPAQRDESLSDEETDCYTGGQQLAPRGGYPIVSSSSSSSTFVVREQARDGNCLFRSFSDQAGAYDRTISQNGLLLALRFLARIQREGEWGDDVEIEDCNH